MQPTNTPHLPRFSVIFAATKTGGIGLQGALPWGTKLPEDLRHFKNVTTNTISSIISTRDEEQFSRNAVIMGRKTWESLPKDHRPLKGRFNIVLSRDETFIDSFEATPNQICVQSLDEALANCIPVPEMDHIENVFVIGGGSLINEALNHPLCEQVFMTTVLTHFDCDVFIKNFAAAMKEYVCEDQDEGFRCNADESIYFFFSRHKRINRGEQQYLDAVEKIINEGNERGDRTGVGTRSIFGMQMRYDLRYEFPLLTTKRVFWRGVAEELLWFIRGKMDAKLLEEKNVHIWDQNGSREFLDKQGLTEYREGELGPVYGHQFRFFGAEWQGVDADYTGKGVDQLAKVIETIKSNPTDRRIIMSAWNPADLPKMALPPCHMFCQFYVHDGKLSCQMYQRSCDMGLGVPFNIASYALLTYMIAHVCGLQPGEFIHTMGDTHVYLNHIEPLRKQLKRTPTAFPRLQIKRKVESIDDFKFEDFHLIDYRPQSGIKMQMAV